jgi:2-oxoglutarate/2-oxoacid ferredoxin oxidoreductase subunit alpha
MNRPMIRVLDDVNVMVAGQGGDGSLTVATLLGQLLGARGFHMFSSRNVASRIKGGQAAAMLRGSAVARGCVGDHLDVLIAFDREAIHAGSEHLSPDGVVIFDSSLGEADAGHLPPGIKVLNVPFGRLAVRDLRRDLFKNSLGFGVLTRVLGIGDEEATGCVARRFERSSAMLCEANLRAVRMGFAFADEAGLLPQQGHWQLASVAPSRRLLISGNDALAFGFIVAGGRVFAGYPITPATDIMEWLAPRLPAFGGVTVQAEDELAAINIGLGAALAGARVMTATSGPGLALMLEGISQLGAAEIPLVIVDCQRAGPSTGMPTKPEQSDIGMLVHGGNGDLPRVVLAPGNPADCFELSVSAVNLAYRLQCPVFLMLDQSVGQDASTVAPFSLEAAAIDQGKRLSAEEIAGMPEYRRYAMADDGVSPWAVPGTPNGMNLVTGNEHDEWGHVTTKPDVRTKMVNKRLSKVKCAADCLPEGRRWGDAGARIGLLGVGMELGVMREAAARLNASGHAIECLQPRTVWPVPHETVKFIRNHDRTYVVEHNAGGQLAHLLKGSGAPADKLYSVLRYDGRPFRPNELVTAVLDGEAQR